MNVVKKGQILRAYTHNAIGSYEDTKSNVHLAYFDEVFLFSHMVKLTL